MEPIWQGHRIPICQATGVAWGHSLAFPPLCSPALEWLLRPHLALATWMEPSPTSMASPQPRVPPPSRPISQKQLPLHEPPPPSAPFPAGVLSPASALLISLCFGVQLPICYPLSFFTGRNTKATDTVLTALRGARPPPPASLSIDTFISTLHTRRPRRTEKLRNVPKVTQLGNAKREIRARGSLVSEFVLRSWELV